MKSFSTPTNREGDLAVLCDELVERFDVVGAEAGVRYMHSCEPMDGPLEAASIGLLKR